MLVSATTSTCPEKQHMRSSSDSFAILSQGIDLAFMKTDPMGSNPAAAPRPATPVVLVVDDEPDVRGLVREVLRTAGVAPLTASRGEDALAIIQHLSGRVDLVLTDVMMPVLDGPTLARQLS